MLAHATDITPGLCTVSALSPHTAANAMPGLCAFLLECMCYPCKWCW